MQNSLPKKISRWESRRQKSWLVGKGLRKHKRLDISFETSAGTGYGMPYFPPNQEKLGAVWSILKLKFQVLITWELPLFEHWFGHIWQLCAYVFMQEYCIFVKVNRLQNTTCIQCYLYWVKNWKSHRLSSSINVSFFSYLPIKTVFSEENYVPPPKLCHNDTDRNPSIISRESVLKHNFGQTLKLQCRGYLEYKVKVIKMYLTLFCLQKMYQCKFGGKNPLVQKTELKKGWFYSFLRMVILKIRWTWKLGQGHQNHVSSSFCHNA